MRELTNRQELYEWLLTDNYKKECLTITEEGEVKILILKGKAHNPIKDDEYKMLSFSFDGEVISKFGKKSNFKEGLPYRTNFTTWEWAVIDFDEVEKIKMLMNLEK